MDEGSHQLPRKEDERQILNVDDFEDAKATRFHPDPLRSKHGNVLTYVFAGSVTGSGMMGDVLIGEYGKARWHARRHGGAGSRPA
jgi:hypothetical protein